MQLLFQLNLAAFVTFTQEVTKGTHNFELRMKALLILALLALTLGQVHGQGYLQVCPL